MLFTCRYCKFAHNVMNVECFYSITKKRQLYLCKEHLHHRGEGLVHMPWDEQLLPESNIQGTCKLCKPTNASCAGFVGTKRPLLIPQNKPVPSFATQ